MIYYVYIYVYCIYYSNLWRCTHHRSSHLFHLNCAPAVVGLYRGDSKSWKCKHKPLFGRLAPELDGTIYLGKL